MNSSRSWKKVVFLTGVLIFASLFLPGPWGTTIIGAAFSYVWEETAPARRAERELGRARTYMPAAEELARYCQTPPLRSMAASRCGELGPAWLPDGVQERVAIPLRASQARSRAVIPWGSVSLGIDSAQVSLPGDIGYYLERETAGAADGASSWTLYQFRGRLRTPLHTFSIPDGSSFTREEALARGNRGAMRLRENATLGSGAIHLELGANFFDAGLDLYLGDAGEARAACRVMMRQSTPGLVLLNGLLHVEEGNITEGENLMLEWISSVEREDRYIYLACFYFYSDRPEQVALALRDMRAQGEVRLQWEPAVLALVRYVYEAGDFESVVEICQSRLQPPAGYQIAAEFYEPYHELIAAATAARNGPEVHGLPPWPAHWQPVDPFRTQCWDRQPGSPYESIQFVEHVLGRPIDPLGPRKPIEGRDSGSIQRPDESPRNLSQ